MTPKKEKVLWSVYALVLVLLFLMSSTDIIIKEKKMEVYPISIIVDDTTDDFYVNFKKGVDQAAIDYHADVSFITLYDRNQAKQQMDMVARELNDGARAIILSPVEDEAVVQALDENIISGPFVIVNSAVSHNKVSCHITEDYYEAGRDLALNIMEETPESVPIYLVTEKLAGSARTMAYDGMMSVFSESPYETSLVEVGSETEYRKLIEGLVYPEHATAVLAALDIRSLVKMAQILDESTVYQEYAAGVYGFGSTLQLLNYLDEGIIQGLVVTNDFIQGYLSIEKAVETIQNAGARESVEIQHFYIEKEDLRKKEYQKLLYPVD